MFNLLLEQSVVVNVSQLLKADLFIALVLHSFDDSLKAHFLFLSLLEEKIADSRARLILEVLWPRPIKLLLEFAFFHAQSGRVTSLRTVKLGLLQVQAF